MSDLNRRVAEALGIRIYGTLTTDNGPCFGHDREWRNEWIVLPNDECADVPDWEHSLTLTHGVVEGILSYRLENHWSAGGMGGLTLIIEGVQFPTITHPIETPDDAAPYLLERWLEIKAAHAEWHAAQTEAEAHDG